ncbi:putative carbohydrate-binding module family 1 protein [Phaeomoniella chlamydospora]|uniref:Putative carbohydrate-binding module family 1 protein n=1 Tax=Phaeomoniella chlamydospora TaxID=158046 RepID=A0A0G2GHC0_PHACM|nr:putative carbohydrate-binding module family 1 protein [Phaeomoniella chlamydospora]
MRPLLSLIPLVSSTIAGTVLWDGRFNDISSSAELAEWSWSNQVGPYQYYIHGNGYVTDYVNLDSSYKNPADSSSTQGVKITIDNTSYWNGQDMRRTELIPQTDAAINKGKVYYHFSISHLSTNPPGTHEEHQIAFFESHFTELKYGLLSGESGTSDSTLRWQVSSVTQWNTTFEAESDSGILPERMI